MLVCVPTVDDAGLDAAIHEHFGSAPYFTLFNTDTEDVEVIENRNAHHSHGTCHPMNQLARFRIDAVVCSGMGRRAVEALNSEGVRTLVSDAMNVREAIRQLAVGSARDIDPNRACRGHGQRPHLDCSERHSGRGSGYGRASSGQGQRRGFGSGPGAGRHNKR